MKFALQVEWGPGVTPFSVCSSCPRSRGEAGAEGGDAHTTLTLLGFLTWTVAVRLVWLLGQARGCSASMDAAPWLQG